MNKYLPLLWIFLLCIITTHFSGPIDVKPSDDEGFSAINAMNHLNIMAEEVHHMGTYENRKVKDYILSEFKKLNIPTEVFVGHTKRQWGSSYARIARTENIIATIKGRTKGKGVMVVGHYDSVLSSPGAADDIHSVACMLEIAKLLSNEDHDNDITFLITDGEEAGLFGAKAYTEQRDVSNIGVLLNYEARGNSGASMSFEWSEGNAWLVQQLQKVATRPVANSMSFEIYKNLPNDTDFTFFKKAGINGINHGFIDGFSYYHNPADTPENINQKSVQHTGTNMLALTRHFANTDLSVTKTHNATFFNFLSYLVIYPSSWDLVILILALVFLVFILYKSFVSGLLQLKPFLISILMIVMSIAISAMISLGLGKVLFAIYRQYEIFYAGQFYNHKYYLITCIGIAILITSLCVKKPVLKSDSNSFKAAMLLVLGILSVIFYIYIPTATYFILYPLIASSIYLLFIIYTSHSDSNSDRNSYISYVLSLIPLVMWLPAIILFFLAFSLVGLPMPTIHVAILALTAMIFFDKLWTKSPVMDYLGGIIIVGSLVMGHFTSEPTQREPLPSSLFYNYDVNDGQAKWASEDKHINIGNKSFLDGAEYSEMMIPYPGTWWNTPTDIEPSVTIPQIVYDTLDANVLYIISQDEVYNTSLQLKSPSNVKSLYINDQEVFIDRETDESMTIEAIAMIADTLTLRIVKLDDGKKQSIGLNSNFRVLPIVDSLPANALRTDGYTGIVQWVEL